MIDKLEKALAENRNVDVADLAERSNNSEATIYRAINRGEIEVTRIGKRVTIPPHVVRRLLHLDPPAAA